MASGIVATFLYIQLYQRLGYLAPQDRGHSIARLSVVALTGAAAESLPLQEYDNLAVGLSTFAASCVVLS